jgi:hypothetical protein
MEELGVRPEGSIIRMLGYTLQKKLRKKYPPPKWEYRYNKGKRIRMRVYPDNKTEETTKRYTDTDEQEDEKDMQFDNELEAAATAGLERNVLDDAAFGDLEYV